MTDGAFRVIRDDGTVGTLDPPPSCAGAHPWMHMTPQVHPMRPTRPTLSFSQVNQRNNRDAKPGQGGTARSGLTGRTLALKGPRL